MKDQLSQLEHLARQARKAVHRGWDAKTAELLAQIQDLANELQPERCWQCGMKPDPAASREQKAKLAARQTTIN